MAIAFILINSEIGREQQVIEQLQNLPNVIEAHVVYGVYDLIAKIEAESTEELKRLVSENLRLLDNVRNTMTMVCVDK